MAVVVAASMMLLLAPQEVKAFQQEVQAQPPNKFMRVERDAEGNPVAFQTAVVRLRSNDPRYRDVEIFLFSAVHIGDKSYYEALNQEFKWRDVVLYELVAPPGTVPLPNDGQGGNPLSDLQQTTRFILNLDSQISCVNYQADNFVHADMSLEDMSAAIKARGGNGMTFASELFNDLVKSIFDEVLGNNRKIPGREINLFASGNETSKKPKPVKEISFLAAMNNAHGSEILKRRAAEEFAYFDADDAIMNRAMKWLLIETRNGKALEVLAKEIAAGRKSIGIFYGAAHMRDFETQLARDYGMQREKEVWLTAWDLRDQDGAISPFSRMAKSTKVEDTFNDAIADGKKRFNDAVEEGKQRTRALLRDARRKLLD